MTGNSTAKFANGMNPLTHNANIRYVPHHVKLKKLCNLPMCCVHVFLIIIVSAVIALYSVIRLIFVVRTGCVFYAEGTECLNIG